MNEITEQRLHSRPNVSTLRSSVFIRGDVETHDLIYCQGDVTYQQDVNILVVNNFRHPYLRHKGSH